MSLALVLDLFGTFFFAVSGSLLAARRQFDIVGSLFLGSVAGLGGGVIRDLVLGQVPSAFDRPVYLIPPLAAALVVFFLLGSVERFRRLLLVFDAGGLALFCITGTVKALEAGMNPAASALLGVTTAVGGGLLRDVVANREPQLFNRRDLYAVPAMLGAGLVTVLWHAGMFGTAAALGVAAVVFGLRVLSLHYGWHIPRAAGTWHGSRRE
ncbi:trimeric intracellular cation channel family protein [Arthrobacter mobilis]|uniref:Trimeric intracellular cation channel family protein n=1 Tax=Arthrobacter mobilis TaxID=2724944 RepID=A0A7X6K2B2_9MICC|nr:trimeric intracellular cation channel family protein [Arthrobacter mobilis]NKX53002.1 trimeric intracellular cation channel family protein [Arthrobacter mobilis]